MTIRWGVSPIAWTNDDMPELGGATTLDQILTDVRDIGFDGVELGNKFPRDPDQLKPIMRRYGLEIIGGWYSTHLLEQGPDVEIAALQGHLRLLKHMGATTFIVAETSNAVHGDRRSRLDRHPVLHASQWQTFGERLSRVAAYLEENGRRLAYHHHLGTAVETADELNRFLEVTDECVGLVLDTGHAVYGGIDPVTIALTHPSRVAHVHCKDVRPDRHRDIAAAGGSFLDGVVAGMFTAPGDGSYDFAPFISALASIDYSGWIVVEAEQNPMFADPREYQQLGLNTLKRLAREMELVT